MERPVSPVDRLLAQRARGKSHSFTFSTVMEKRCMEKRERCMEKRQRCMQKRREMAPFMTVNYV